MDILSYVLGKKKSGGYDTGFDDGREEGQEKVYSTIEPYNAELERILYGADTGSADHVLLKLPRNVDQLDSDIQAIKSAIESNGVEVADKTPTSEYAPKIEGLYEAGKKSEYDAFWDVYQDNGKAKSYKCAFGGYGWTTELFRPKHNIIATNCNYMFSTCTRMAGIDLEKHFEELGITFDTSGVTGIDGFDYFCQYASPSVLPVIDTRGTTQIRNFLFHTSDLVTVRKVIFKDDGSQKFTNPFQNNSKLENIEFEGVIGQNGINVQQCEKLTHDSLMSLINTLKDYSGTDTWMTVTLGSKNIAKLTTAELEIMDKKQWNYG